MFAYELRQLRIWSFNASGIADVNYSQGRLPDLAQHGPAFEPTEKPEGNGLREGGGKHDEIPVQCVHERLLGK